MIRTSIAALIGAPIALLVAWELGGRMANGVVAGFLLGAGMTGLGVLYQRHALLHRPKQAFTALGVSMLAKLAVLLLGAMAFRYLEPAAARADWRAFVVAFAASTALLIAFGSWDLAATMRGISRRSRAGSSAEAGSAEREAGDGAAPASAAPATETPAPRPFDEARFGHAAPVSLGSVSRESCSQPSVSNPSESLPSDRRFPQQAPCGSF
ncbi:MAG: hypothetical protein WD226_07645 [Planctomycetota bacterium]